MSGIESTLERLGNERRLFNNRWVVLGAMVMILTGFLTLELIPRGSAEGLQFALAMGTVCATAVLGLALFEWKLRQEKR